MNNTRAVYLLVAASAFFAAGCSSDGGDAGQAQGDAKPAQSDELAPEVAPGSRPNEGRDWSGRSETEHTWITVKLTVDSSTRVSHFHFDSGCLGSEESLVGWGPEGEVASIAENGEFSFAADGIEARGTFHGDDHVEGVIVDGVGFGFNCEAAPNQPIPGTWRISG